MANNPKSNLDPSLMPQFMMEKGATTVEASGSVPGTFIHAQMAGQLITKKKDSATNLDRDNIISKRLRSIVQSEAIATDGRITVISKIEGKREALCCKYNEEYDYVAVGYADGVVGLYQSGTGEPVLTLSDADVKQNRAPVTCIKHKPVSKNYPVTNCFTCTYANGCVKSWSYNFNQCVFTIKEKRQTYGIVYHPRFPKFVTFGDDSKIYFYDEETRVQERVLTPRLELMLITGGSPTNRTPFSTFYRQNDSTNLIDLLHINDWNQIHNDTSASIFSSDKQDAHDGHMSRVFAACFHTRNNYEFITGGWDDVVQFWDLRQPYAVRHVSGVHMCGEGLDISQRGTEVLTCAWQKEHPIQIFDYGSGKRISSLEPDVFNSKLYCGKFATKDFIVCGGTDPNILRVTDLQTTATSAMLHQLPSAVYGLDLGPQKPKVRESKSDKYIVKNDITSMPKIAFVSGKKSYQVDFL